MHIRTFIGAALLAMACLAFAPVAMAGTLTHGPDICAVDLAPAHAIEFDLDAPSCAVVVSLAETADFASMGGDEDEAAGPLKLMLATFDPSGSRLHFDPGRQRT